MANDLLKRADTVCGAITGLIVYKGANDAIAIEAATLNAPSVRVGQIGLKYCVIQLGAVDPSGEDIYVIAHDLVRFH